MELQKQPKVTGRPASVAAEAKKVWEELGEAMKMTINPEKKLGKQCTVRAGCC